jgi:pimeloyl-ACP methyl ester carboxylesterase
MTLRRFYPVLFLLLISNGLRGVHLSERDTIIYLFPGQGADARQFKHLELPPGYDTIHISYPVPEKRESLSQFAMRFIAQIDTSSPYILMGVSLGGMICTELSDTIQPLRTIIISSAKTTEELPNRYTFQQNFPLNRIIPKRLTKGGARLLQGIVEPDRKYDKETFKDMLKQKDPLYLKRTVDMIINWDRTEYPDHIVHIHGDKDHTIPIKNITYDYLLEDGSHMMMITRAGEINKIIGEILGHATAD